MTDNVINFICNNIKGIQTSQKRIKLVEYLKGYVATNGSVFLQEFRGKLFFSPGKTNSCGVLIGY